MDKKQTDAIAIRQRLQPSDDLIIVGVAVVVPADLTHLLERVETELWKAPPEPLLEQISVFLSSGGKEWIGTPTELTAHLGVDMKPNALTRRLNVNAGRLLNEYGIRYESRRNRNERTVKLAAAERS